MKALILLSLIAATLTTAKAHAAAPLNLLCVEDRSANQMNGLNISWAQLIVSQEDPVATLNLKYKGSPGGGGIKTNMDYQGTNTRYVLTPSTQRDGHVKVSLKYINGDWKATFTSDSIDTFTVLHCSHRSPNQG